MEFWVNISQIISAIATAAAVIVAIWLALRSEKQRPKFFVSRNLTIVVGPEGTEHKTKHQLILTVINSGILPIIIQNVSFSIRLSKNDSWGCSTPVTGQKDTSLNFPIKLEHGEQIRCSVPVTNDERPWKILPKYWWIFNRPYFNVTTGVGRSYQVKASRKVLLTLATEANLPLKNL